MGKGSTRLLTKKGKVRTAGKPSNVQDYYVSLLRKLQGRCPSYFNSTKREAEGGKNAVKRYQKGTVPGLNRVERA